MQRIIFTGEDLADFPKGEEGAYVKVILEEDKKNIDVKVSKPKMRSISVAEYDYGRGLLTLDFAVYHDGYLSDWAITSRTGDKVVIGGPGPRKIYDFPVTDYFLMGDATSMNAVFAYLKYAPKEATGKAIIAVPHEQDFRERHFDNNIELTWTVQKEKDYFLQPLKNYSQLSEKTIVFGGGESGEIDQVEHYLISEKGLSSDNIYLSGYWKQGHTDEEYREFKKSRRR